MSSKQLVVSTLLAAVFCCGSADALTLFSSDFQADTAGTMPGDAALPLYPGSPGPGLDWTIAYDPAGTGVQVWDNLDPSNPNNDPGSNHYLTFTHSTTNDAVAWAHGWDPADSLNRPVQLSFDLWVVSTTDTPRYLCISTFDSHEGSWWSSGRAWSLYFHADGSIEYYDGAYNDTGLTFTTDSWEQVVISADMEAQTYSLTVGGSSVDLAWGGSSSTAGTHSVGELFFQGCEHGGVFCIDNVRLIAVPEPSTLALLATGLFGLLAYARRKRK